MEELMLKIYTRIGDKGQSGIIGGRVDKDDIRVEAYGTVDASYSFVGQPIVELNEQTFSDVLEDLEKIQHELFDGGGDLASVSKKRPLKITEDAITYLEERIDEMTEETPDIERLILPGGAKPAASIHIARNNKRRAERHFVRLLKQDETVPPVTLQYLNRLSDYFFALARVINARLGVNDVEYVRSARVFRSSKKKEK